jgi:glycosyltransferase involved in cell wall biosynthesis
VERVSVVIPIRNEEACIGRVLDDLRKATAELPHYQFETIVVDDGSTDGGAEIARSYGAQVVPNGPPHGKGAALRTGFARAAGDVIVMMDGDYSHMAEDMGALLGALRPGVSLVIASRSFGGSDEFTPVRAFGNIALSYLFGVLHGRYLSDSLNGYKAFRREVFTRFEYTSVAFEIEIELLSKALRCGRIVEVGSHERARAGGSAKSKVVRHGSGFLVKMIRERWQRVDDAATMKRGR